MPKYSFVIPVYNCRPYLEECVESILKQTVSDLEILLVDDGSADGSGELCDELAIRDGRIRVFHKKNGGAGSARNLGIEKSEGRYLLFVDGDDTIERNSLKILENDLSENIGMLVFGMLFDYYGKNGISRTEKLSSAYPGMYSIDEIAGSFDSLFDDNVLSSACNKVFDLAIIRSKGLRYNENMDLFEDLAFVLNYMSNIQEVLCIENGLYHYRLSTSENHLHKRVYEIDRLEDNMTCLLEAGKAFMARVSNAKPVGDTLISLNMQLLSLHLFLHHYGAKKLRSVAIPYCSNATIREFIENGVTPNKEGKELLDLIEQDRFSYLSRMFRLRFIRASIKKRIKRMLSPLWG